MPAMKRLVIASLLASSLAAPPAAALTIDAEADFRRGLEVNVLGLVHLLEACRAMARPPRLVFASSIAAWAGSVGASSCVDAKLGGSN